MRLLLRNHLFSRYVYDDSNRLLYIIKGHVFSARKTVLSADGSVIYETNISNLHESQKRDDAVADRQYAICTPDASSKCHATADLVYASSVAPSNLKRLMFKAPLVDQLILHMKESGKPIITRMHKDGTFKITDSENNPLGTIHRYRLFKGYEIDYDAYLNGAFVIALFELTRYLIKENELAVV